MLFVIFGTSPHLSMFDVQIREKPSALAVASVHSLFCLLCLLMLAGEPATAQDRGRARPSVRSTPSQHRGGSAVQRGRIDRPFSEAPGMALPSATRPSDPPSFGPSPRGANPAGAGAQTNDGPTMPNNPPQAPIGGAEWLAAAGAAYALNRLQKSEATDEQDKT